MKQTIVNNFYDISIPLKYQDTLKLCISNKTFNSLCNESYWQLKAQQNYGYDLKRVNSDYGNNNAKKYKWVERVMDTPDNMNILVDPYDSYFWNKKIDRDFGIVDAVGPNGNGTTVYSNLTRFESKTFIASTLIAMMKDNYPGLKQFLIRYGPEGILLYDRIPMSIPLQQDIQQMYVTDGDDRTFEYEDIFNKWINQGRFSDIYMYVERFNSYVDKVWNQEALYSLVNLLVQNNSFPIVVLELIAKVIYLLVENGEYFGKHKDVVIFQSLDYIIRTSSIPLVVAKYLIEPMDIASNHIMGVIARQIVRSPSNTDPQTRDYLKKYIQN